MYAGKLRYQKSKVASEYHKRRTMGIKGSITHYLEHRLIEKAIKHVLTDCKTALDVPCGDGRLIPLYKSLGLDLSYADISDEMMAIAKEKTSGPFYKMDLESPNIDKTFDLVLCIRLMDHLPESVKVNVLRSLHSLTNKYVILTYSTPSLQSKRRELKYGNQGGRFPIKRDYFIYLANIAGFSVIREYRLLPYISETNVMVLKRQNDI